MRTLADFNVDIPSNIRERRTHTHTHTHPHTLLVSQGLSVRERHEVVGYKNEKLRVKDGAKGL